MELHNPYFAHLEQKVAKKTTPTSAAPSVELGDASAPSSTRKRPAADQQQGGVGEASGEASAAAKTSPWGFTRSLDLEDGNGDGEDSDGNRTRASSCLPSLRVPTSKWSGHEMNPRGRQEIRQQSPGSNNACRSWLREEGCAGVAVVVQLALVLIYMAVIFVLHETTLVDVLVDETDSLPYLGVTSGVQAVVGFGCVGILLRCIRQLYRVTCGIMRVQDRVVGRYNGTIRSRLRIFRAYHWQRSWVGVSGPHFANFTFAKEVVEITLQSVALYHASVNGVSKGFLQFHAFVIALNSISAVLISLRVTSTRSQLVLLIDSGADFKCKSELNSVYVCVYTVYTVYTCVCIRVYTCI